MEGEKFGALCTRGKGLRGWVRTVNFRQKQQFSYTKAPRENSAVERSLGATNQGVVAGTDCDWEFDESRKQTGGIVGSARFFACGKGNDYRYEFEITTSRLTGMATGSLLTVPGVKRY
jgi:hypothetical protein